MAELVFPHQLCHHLLYLRLMYIKISKICLKLISLLLNKRILWHNCIEFLSIPTYNQGLRLHLVLFCVCVLVVSVFLSHFSFLVSFGVCDCAVRVVTEEASDSFVKCVCSCVFERTCADIIFWQTNQWESYLMGTRINEKQNKRRGDLCTQTQRPEYLVFRDVCALIFSAMLWHHTEI